MISITSEIFGKVKNPITNTQEDIKLFTLTNANGLKVCIMTYGATITSIEAPDGYGYFDDIVLGYKDLEGYLSETNPHMGGTIGRVCNIIQSGRLKVGEEIYQLQMNTKRNHVHGGAQGFDKMIWKFERRIINGIVLSHISPDNYAGYPGELTVFITFTLNEDNELNIKMQAECNQMTAVNMTNHTYFNLAGQCCGREALYDHSLVINADNYTELNKEEVPTGNILPVNKTIYDFRTEKGLRQFLVEPKKRLSTTPSAMKLSRAKAKAKAKYVKVKFDDNFCVNVVEGVEMTTMARAHHRLSGRWLEISSNQPGLQFLTASNFPDPENDATAEPLSGKANYTKHAGFSLQTQKYPNAPAIPTFPTIILEPGQQYCHEVVYKFGADRVAHMLHLRPYGPKLKC